MNLLTTARQTYLTTQALITDSWLIGTGIVLSLLSIGLLAWAGTFYYLALLITMILAVGIGYSARKFRDWETTSTIPELHQHVLQTSMLLAGLLWAFLSLFLIWKANFVFAPMIIAALIISAGLWLGGGDRVLWLPTLFIVAFVVAVVWAAPHESQIRKIAFIHSGIQTYIFSFVCSVLSVIFAARYVHQAQSRKPWSKAVDASSSHSSSSIRPDRGWLVRRVDRLCHDFPNQGSFLFLLVTGVLFVGFLYIKARGNERALFPLVLFISIGLIISPTAILMYRISPSFNLLLLSGIRPNRAKTIRLMMSIMLIRLGVLLLFSVAMILATLWWEPTKIVATIVILFGATAIGAICMILASWTRRWWASVSDYAFTLFAVVATLGSGVLLSITEEFVDLAELHPMVLPIAIPAVLFGNAIIWYAALMEVPRALKHRLS